MSLFNHYYEVPPTAGLPTHWSDWLPTHNDLTKQLSQLFNLPPLLLTCSGTAALVIALTTLAKENPTRKQVIVPAYTCPLVVLAIHHCGLKVTLCDLAPNSFDFNFIHLASLVNDQILAIIPTHLGGRTANVQLVKTLSIPYNIYVIEDAAQALGADVGQHGDIVFFSLAAGKGLTLYEGGLLTSHNKSLRDKLTLTATSIIKTDKKWEITRTLELLGYTLLYNPFGLYFAYGNPKRKQLKKNQLIEAVGDDFDFKLPLHTVSQLRQQIATNSLKRLPTFIEKTTSQALQRVTQLNEIENITVFSDTSNYHGTWPFIMVLLPSKTVRDAIMQELWAGPLGITRLFIHALPDYQYLETVVPKVNTPNAKDLADRLLTISNSLWLKEEQFQTICQIIRKTIENQ